LVGDFRKAEAAHQLVVFQQIKQVVGMSGDKELMPLLR
jgi:hypothetical protein